jgi:hypothetical protein
MRRGVGSLAALAALVVVAASHADSPSPSDVLAQAQQQTAQAKSMQFGMTMSFRQGGQTFTLGATGTELPAQHRASLEMDLSHLSPTLGSEKVLMVGPHAYIHLGVLSTPAARRKGIKPWIVQDSASAIGVDPWSLGGSGSQDAIHDVQVAGTGVDDGVAVTRYTAKIALRKALAANPQFQKLIQASHAPASLLNTQITATFDIDDLGYLRDVTEAFTLRLPGQAPLALSLDFTLSNFDEAVQPIIAPPSYDTMTMDEFRQATGTALPVA